LQETLRESLSLLPRSEPLSRIVPRGDGGGGWLWLRGRLPAWRWLPKLAFRCFRPRPSHKVRAASTTHRRPFLVGSGGGGGRGGRGGSSSLLKLGEQVGEEVARFLRRRGGGRRRRWSSGGRHGRRQPITAVVPAGDRLLGRLPSRWWLPLLPFRRRRPRPCHEVRTAGAAHHWPLLCRLHRLACRLRSGRRWRRILLAVGIEAATDDGEAGSCCTKCLRVHCSDSGVGDHHWKTCYARAAAWC